MEGIRPQMARYLLDSNTFIWAKEEPQRLHKEALRAQAALFKLPALLRRIERLLDSKTHSE